MNFQRRDAETQRRDPVLLGLYILSALTPRRHRRTLEEIAAFAGITRCGVWMIERRALRKLQRMVFLRNDPTLLSLCPRASALKNQNDSNL